MMIICAPASKTPLCGAKDWQALKPPIQRGNRQTALTVEGLWSNQGPSLFTMYAIALAIISMANADASALPLDGQTRAAIREGLAQAERGEFVPDDVVAAADQRHGI